MFKRILVLACVVMACILAGCGKSQGRTKVYWETWAQLRKTHDDTVNQLKEREVVADALKCAEEGDWLADQTRAIATKDVDPELVKLAAEAIDIYRQRSMRYREMAGLMSRSEANDEIWADFNKRGEQMEAKFKDFIVRRANLRARLIDELGTPLSQ